MMELRRLKAPFEPRTRSAIDRFDCGNSRVNGFLRNYAEPIVDQGLGTVLLLVEDGEILSFVSLAFASLTLTNAEKGAFRSVTTAFGAVRIGSIGTATPRPSSLGDARSRLELERHVRQRPSA